MVPAVIALALLSGAPQAAIQPIVPSSPTRPIIQSIRAYSPRRHLGLGWYLAPVVGHGLDLGSTALAFDRGASELAVDVYGDAPSIKHVAAVKGGLCAGQLLAIFILYRAGQRDAAKTVSAISIYPAAAGGWNFAVTFSR
jgi:hypothetical protein